MIGKKSDEIFREESIQVSHKHVLKFKQIKTPKQLQYDQIRFLVNLKACRTSLLLRLYLKKIALARDIFVLDISQGGLFEIPKEINQSNLPQSYSYYDHLYNYIQEHMTTTTTTNPTLRWDLKLYLHCCSRSQQQPKQKPEQAHPSQQAHLPCKPPGRKVARRPAPGAPGAPGLPCPRRYELPCRCCAARRRAGSSWGGAAWGGRRAPPTAAVPPPVCWKS